jgi:glycosyltransferase involved in cell wall biosynthesis
MRIGIDARLYGNKHTGIGRYTRNLVLHLIKVDKVNRYVIFGNSDIKKDLAGVKNFTFRELNTPIYSFKEQIINPRVFKKAKLDLLHVPHFNAPILYSGKLILTIHDLIKHLSTGKTTSTLPPVVYWFKHLVYRFVVFLNIRKASALITPSNFWKNNLVNNYSLDPQKVHVTYEAVGDALKANKKTNIKNLLKEHRLRKPFVIYTGNLYPHKNVEFLIRSINDFNSTHKHQLTLGIVSARSVFENRVGKEINVRYLGYVSDQDLAALYSQALALVQPSLIEGFGLTGLEAMASGLPVLSSNATCLPEVYGDAALYFDPFEEASLILRLDQIMTQKDLAQKLKKKGHLQSKKFSWKKTARETLKAYNQVLKDNQNS